MLIFFFFLCIKAFSKCLGNAFRSQCRRYHAYWYQLFLALCFLIHVTLKYFLCCWLCIYNACVSHGMNMKCFILLKMAQNFWKSFTHETFSCIYNYTVHLLNCIPVLLMVSLFLMSLIRKHLGGLTDLHGKAQTSTTSLEVLKTWLDKILSDLLGIHYWLSLQ